MEEIARMHLTFRSKNDDPGTGKFGIYLGRGDGVVEGEKLKGGVIWDLYEIQGRSACDANLVGTVRTLDGADIGFEVLGYFSRRTSTARWDLSSAIRFTTCDSRYRCFDECVGLVAGHFDMNTCTHEYQVSAPRCTG